MRSTTLVRSLAVLNVVFLVFATEIRAQCGIPLARTLGGETRAVAQISTASTLLLAGTGVDVHIVNAPTPATMTNLTSGNPRLVLSAPVVKLSMTPGSTRAFALLENGQVAVIGIGSVGIVGPFPNALSLIDVREQDAVDVLANGTQAWVVRGYEAFGAPYDQSNYSQVDYIDGSVAGGTPISTVLPYVSTMFFDKLTRIGNNIWVGMHGHLSNIYGVAGYNYTVPASPTSIANPLNVPPGSLQYASVVAMTPIAGGGGGRIFMSYGFTAVGHYWIRGLDVSTPTSPGWLTETDIGGLRINDLGSSGNLLHIAWTPGALTIWDVTNPNSPSAQGTFAVGGVPNQVLVTGAAGGTDFVAGGVAGLVAANTSNPTAMTQRAAITQQPPVANITRQSGANTAIIDTNAAALRMFDFSGSGAVAHGTLALTDTPSLMEISVQGINTYACIANSTPITTVRVYDISNPDVLFYRGSFMATSGISMMSCTGSRLYAVDGNALDIIDISNPQFPTVRSRTVFGSGLNYRALESWTNAVALGTNNGLLLIDTTNAAAPVLRSTYAPGGETYNVVSLVKTPAELYASVAVTPTGDQFYHPQIDSFNASNLASPSVEGTLYTNNVAEAMMYAGLGSNNFLITTEYGSSLSQNLFVCDLAWAAVPTEIAAAESWGRPARQAVSSDGSRLYVAAGAGGVLQNAIPTEWAPVFFHHVLPDVNGCVGGTAVFISGLPAVTASPGATFQWHRYESGGVNSVILSDGPTPWGSMISGSQTQTMVISSARASDTGFLTPGRVYYYSCTATNACGSDSTTSARLIICLADFNCDGVRNVGDIFAFLGAFFAQVGQTGAGHSADFNGDGVVNVSDIFVFLGAWFAGC